MSIKITKNYLIDLIKKLSNNYKNIIIRNDINNYPEINWGNNGIGDRFCRKLFNYSVINSNGKYKTYSNNNETIDINEIKLFVSNMKSKNSGIIGIMIHSIKDDSIQKDRPIRKEIRDFYKNKPCVVCGTLSEVIDHKNDLYDDMRVLDTKTQTHDDFQALCNHCNLQKRQVCKKEKETGILYDGFNIPIINVFKSVNMKLLEQNKVNTFWYDPVKYCNKIKEYYENKILKLELELELNNNFSKSLVI